MPFEIINCYLNPQKFRKIFYQIYKPKNYCYPKGGGLAFKVSMILTFFIFPQNFVNFFL